MLTQRFHALLIGVGDYLHPRFVSLPATVRDALAIANTLTDPDLCGYPSQNVRVLTGLQATGSDVRSALRLLVTTADPDSTVWIYFSGHGGRIRRNRAWQTYLCPREADPDDLPRTALSGDEFSELLSKIPASRLLVMLDACHAATSADLKSPSNKPAWKSGLPDGYYDALGRGAGRVIISSSKSDQQSWVRRDGDLSLFTFHLLEALRGSAAVRGDGLIHVLDVFDYVNYEVQREQANQVPILKVKDLDLNFPIALARGGKATGLASTIVPSSTWQEQPMPGLRMGSIREQIVRDPLKGAKMLSSHLASRPEWVETRVHVDALRAQIEEFQHNLNLYGLNPADQAAKSRVVHSLLKICIELEQVGFTDSGAT